ncbi:hypothetical protein [Nitrosospira sp. Is2]|uniref:hypothetical protein n=1 Tax=Nitrosospira sp. Is2 TaxID=3080532 RepID=UPI002952F3A1|nr:hypothetical protein [Nitrosospira sp. Is2]WON73952.1 hypothetical protein R5L00_00240 [Nitrosospira sp. Is2]
MNTHHCYTLRNLILVAVLTIGFASSALAQERERALLVDLNSKEVTSLGTLGGPSSRASVINDSGQVAGTSLIASEQDQYHEYHAFITGSDGAGMTDLGTLGGPYSRAYGINNEGRW